MAGSRGLLELAGYVALLLWGLHMVQSGVIRSLGVELRQKLRITLGHPLKAFLGGIGVTALLQSSTATALMLGSFLTGGLIDLTPALAVMLGANVGTTLIVQVLTFDISAFASILILVGLIAFKQRATTKIHDLGRVAIGLGLMLLALKLMVGLLAPVEQAAAIRELFAMLASDPVLNLIVAALLTWAAHSSVAVVLLVMSLAATHAVSTPAALAFVLGANLGNTIPPLIASSSSTKARQLAVGNLITRLTGCVLLLPILPAVAGGMEAIEASPARQIADFHTLFNLGLAVLFLIILVPFSRLCERLVPASPRTQKPGEPRYIAPSILSVPSVALAEAAREALRMSDTVGQMLATLRAAMRQNDRKLLAQIGDMDDALDELHSAVKLYLVEISQEDDLFERESRRCSEILAFIINLEHIGDIIDKSLREIVAKKIKYQLTFSPEGSAEIEEMFERVVNDLQLAVSVFMNGDERMARKLVDEKGHMRDLERQATENHLRRLRERRPQSMETSGLHIDIARDLKRIVSHIASVAYPILEEKGALRRTRLVD